MFIINVSLSDCSLISQKINIKYNIVININKAQNTIYAFDEIEK